MVEEQPIECPAPYTIDDTSLETYYQGLDPEIVEHDVELMTAASTKELYELIMSNCQHYVSIIENYKEENLQTLFNMTVRRIEGHLLIKFKLNTEDRWQEVGFFDDENTDAQTLLELKNMIKFHLKNYDEHNTDRRKHIAMQMETDETSCPEIPKKEIKKALPDNYFDPKNNPDLAFSTKQLASAGYKEMPESLRGVMEKIRRPVDAPLELEKFSDKPHVTGSEEKTEQEPTIDESMKEFKTAVKQQIKTALPSQKQVLQQMTQFNHQLIEQMMTDMREQEQLMVLFDQLVMLLQTTPQNQQFYIYQMASELIGKMKSSVVANLIMELTQKVHTYGLLSPTQKEIIKKYDINLSNL